MSRIDTESSPVLDNCSAINLPNSDKSSLLSSTAKLVSVSDAIAKGPSTDLDQLAACIKDHHIKAKKYTQSAIDHALAAGDFLNKAKAQVPHGKWQEWVTSNTTIPFRTASHYMKLAANRDTLSSKSANVADLSVSQAMKLIRGSKPRPSLKESKEKRPPSPQEIIKQFQESCVAVSKLNMTARDAFAVSQRAVSTLGTAWEHLADKEADSIGDRLQKIIGSSVGSS